MNGQEFATAVQYDLPIVVILLDNGMYGTIRMHQEREYPGRVSATMLKNPDFAAYARAFGGHGERVETTEEFAPAFERALRSGKPAILHCLIDPEAITPTTTLTQLARRRWRRGVRARHPGRRAAAIRDRPHRALTTSSRSQRRSGPLQIGHGPHRTPSSRFSDLHRLPASTRRGSMFEAREPH